MRARAGRGALAVCFLALALPVRAAESGLPELIERFDHLEVGDAVEVAGQTLAAGRFTGRLASGRAAPVRAGAAVVGLFFVGQGAFEYLSADPVEAPVVLFDARKGSNLKARKTAEGVVLQDSFRRLLWIARGTPVPELRGAPAPPLVDEFRKERAKFGRLHAAPLSHDFALQRLNAPAAPLVWAEMDGGKEDLVYELDRVDHPSEALLLLHASESRDPELRKFLWPVALSHQPIDRDARDPAPPRFLLTAVDVDLTATAGNDATMTVEETVVPAGAPLRALRFDLVDVWYAQAGSNLATRSEKVRAVTDGAGRSLAFDHRGDEIVVALAEEAPAGQPVRLRFQIEGDFLIRPGGDNYWELGVTSWFPQPYLGEQAYTFHAVVRVPPPFVAFASGKTLRRATEDGRNVVETRVENPIQCAVILAGRYEVHEESRDGVTIRVATYALENESSMKKLTGVAAEIIAFYRGFLGPFPFDDFDVIEINDVGYGQAPPGILFITQEAFDPLVGDMTLLSARGILRTFAHEIAHQYWGIAVRIPGYSEQWIAESFAEYCAALFLKARRGAAVADALASQWKRAASYAGDAAPIPMASRVYVANDAVQRSQIRQGLLYGKGPLVLDAVRRDVGDEGFLEALRAFQASRAWKFGSTRAFADLLGERTRRDWMPFFDRYYWGVEMPK
ncbi:MAG TPA: M1 family aminopeptidase [Thermoanaerobaculia bacterium]|nr:M1 family aminopeptidase [Thermoanaerobaculia bacterium]